MKNFSSVKLGIIMVLLAPALALGAGKLKGKVVDAQSKDPMIGANILLAGTSIGGVSDIYGNYLLPAVPAGKYTVRCAYIGYVGKTASVTVVDGQTAEINFSIVPDVIEGSEVVISAQAFGQSAAINQQLSSNTIVNVISEQKIKELPDANAAEAIGRLPGVSVIRSGGEASKIILRGLGENMTTITVDGVKLSPTDADSRGIDLSAISQGSLSGIELSKAITADMDAEAIAGNVNFVTKIAPEKREAELTGYGMYGAMEKTYDQYNFVGRYGERFFDDFLGVQLFGNIEQRNRSSEQYNIGFRTDPSHAIDPRFNAPLNTYTISNFGLQYSPETRKRRGGKILLDIKTPDEGVLRLNGEINRTERRLSVINRNYPTLGGDVTYHFRGQDIDTDIKNVSLQGKNHPFNWDVDWSMSYNESGTQIPYDYATHLGEASTLDGQGNIISSMLPVPKGLLTGNDYEKIIPYALNNFMKAYYNRGEARTTSSLDYEKSIFLNAKKSYNLADMAGEFKFGGKYRSKYHRRNSTLSQALYYNGTGFYDDVKNADGTVTKKDYARYGYSNIYRNAGLILLPNFISGSRAIYGKYSLNPLISASRMRDWYDMNINGYNTVTHKDEYEIDNSQKGSDYNLTENVLAAYAMNTLKLGDVATLIAGLRIESDNNTYQAYYAKQEVTQYAMFTDTTATHTETIVLPNLHVILKPTDFLNVRLAAYRGINRPDFNSRLPTYYFGYNIARFGDGNKVIVSNKPDLKNANAWNYEANMQFYGKHVGLFSISAYYKKINNLVSTINFMRISDKKTMDSLGVKVLPGTSFGNLLVYTPYNSQSPTKVWGFEIEHQANMNFLPGLLSNIVLSYNLTVSKTETYSADQTVVTDSVYDDLFETYIRTSKAVISERKTKISNAPELFGNLSVGYDISGFSGRVSYFYQRHFFTSLSADNRTNYIQKSFGRVDLSLKQEVTDYLTLGLNVNNLTNASEGALQSDDVQGWQAEVSDYNFGTTADLWLKVSL